MTQLTAGITLSVDFDSVTGLNNIRVVATGGNGYLTATNYTLVITTGTVNSVSVVGECVGSFSIENRSALMPTTAALTLDVSATGEAGVDWGNVGSKTTTNALTNTSIITTQKVDIDTIKTNPVVNGGTITFPTTATLASTTNITAGTITTTTNLTNLPAITANWLTAAGTAADFGVEVAAAVWQDAVAGDFTVASSIGKSLYTGNVAPGGTNGLFIAGTNAATTITTALTTTFTGSLTGSVASVTGAVGSVTGLTASDVGAIKTKTDSLTFTVAGVVDCNQLRTNGDATAAANIAKTTRAIGRGTVGSASTTTSIVTSSFTPTGVVADQFKGRIITFDADTTTTALRGQPTDITASSAVAAPVFTVTALTTAPVSGDTFSVT